MDIKKVIEERVGVEVTEDVIIKNGVEKKCLLIGDGNTKMVLYRSDIDISNEEDIDDLISYIKRNLVRNESIGNDAEFIKDFDNVKDKLIVCVSEKRDIDDGILRRDFLDISQYVRIDLNYGYSVSVRKDFLEMWNISEDELFDTALKNDNYEVRDVSEILFGVSGDDSDVHMYVVTNSKLWQGAGCICNPQVLDRVAEVVGGDLVILPSSVNEVLAVKDTGNNDYYDELREIVNLVNSTEVTGNDFLSNNVYKYSKEDRQLRVA